MGAHRLWYGPLPRPALTQGRTAVGDWSAGYVEANGIRLHYTRTDGTKPPVVLAHGVTDDGLCWAPLAQALAPEYDLVMVDARGHGRSDASEGGYGPAEQAADLAGVIGGLGLRRPAILGHSMGAATALALAGIYPDLPGAVLLEDPPTWWTRAPGAPPVDPEERAGWRERIIGHKRKTREELIAAKRAEAPGWSEVELGRWADAKLRLSPNVLALFDPGDAAPVDWRAILPRIACPVLLITADPALGALVTEEAATDLRVHVPRLRIAHVPGAGHNVRRDQFARYLDVVRRFLAEWATSDEQRER